MLNTVFCFFGKKKVFFLFAGNPNNVNSSSQRQSNPDDGSYSRNPFVARTYSFWHCVRLLFQLNVHMSEI